MKGEERFWPARIRWRLRGATMWPAFIVVTLVDGIILHRLPPVSTGVDIVPGILLATFGNLVLIGVLAPWLAKRTWARRPAAEPGTPPRAQLEVLTDRMGTGLLLAGVLGVCRGGSGGAADGGLGDRGHRAQRRGLSPARNPHPNPELIRNLETANTVRLSEDYFRTCIARDDRERYFCAFIDTSGERPQVTLDRSAESNSNFRAAP